MHPFLKFFIRVFLILIICVIIIKPYNLYCSTTNNCSTFSLSQLIPSTKFNEGSNKVKVEFVSINNNSTLVDFRPDVYEFYTVTGRKNVVKFRFKNVSNRENPIKFRMELSTDPGYLIDSIKKYDCLCHDSYKIKMGQEITKEFVFAFDDQEIANYISYMFDDDEKDRIANIKIKYRIIYED